MKNSNRYTVLSVLLLALIYVGGCAGPTTTAPRRWFPLYPTSPENVTVNSTKSSLPDAKPIVNEGIGPRLGILGTSVPGIEDINGIMPGGEFGVFYRKGPLVLDLNSRLFGSTYQNSEIASFSAAIGGRYHFLNKRNISPYLGGGLIWSHTHYEIVERELREVCLRWSEQKWFLFIPYRDCLEWGEEWQDILYTYQGRGLGAYGVIGIEFRHLQQSRFNLELRIDNPSYELLELDAYENQRSVSLGTPISLGMSLLHQF